MTIISDPFDDPAAAAAFTAPETRAPLTARQRDVLERPATSVAREGRDGSSDPLDDPAGAAAFTTLEPNDGGLCLKWCDEMGVPIAGPTFVWPPEVLAELAKHAPRHADGAPPP